MTKTKKILFLFLAMIFFHFNCIGQSGCPWIYAGTDVILDSTGCTTLHATVQETGATTSYWVPSIPYTPPDSFNAGTQILTNIDDTWSSPVNLPFTFCFFGVAYNQLVVGSNGCISFSTSNAGNYCDWQLSSSCPDPTILSTSIGPYVLSPYHDIDPTNTGGIFYNISGAYPCRTIVISWNEIPMYSSSCDSLFATQMIVLYETTNIVEVYIQNAPLCPTWNSGNKCIGIQNASGTIGYVPSGRNTGAWSASNEAWRFVPNGVPNYSIYWYQGANQIATGDSVTVCPTSTTTYTAEVVYNDCDASQVTITDDVTVSASSGINEINNINSPRIIPNPVHDIVYIKTFEKIKTIEIFDYTGRILLKEKLSNDQNIDISALAKGTYIIKMTNDKETLVEKIIKE